MPKEPVAATATNNSADLIQAEFQFLREVSGFCRLIEERIVEREEIIKMLLNIPMAKWQIVFNGDGTIFREYISADHENSGAIKYEVDLQVKRDFGFDESDSRHYGFTGRLSYCVKNNERLAVFDLSPFPTLIQDCYATIKSKLGEAEYFEKQTAPILAKIQERLRNYAEVLEIIKSFPLERAISIDKAPNVLNDLAHHLVESYNRQCREGWFSLEDVDEVVKLTNDRYQAFLMNVEIRYHDRYGNADPERSNLIVIYDKQNSASKKIYFTFTEPFHAGIQQEIQRIWSELGD